jgi:molecular chaperone DnaJ
MPQQAKKDHYQTLGIARPSDEDEIRKAYRKLARKYHPDLNPGDKAAEDRFKAVQEAYDILSDPKKKKMYDQFGFYSDNMPGSGPGGPGGPGGFPGQPGFDFSGFDFGDLFGGQGGPGAASAGGGQRRPPAQPQGGESFRDFFSQFFGGGQQQQRSQPEAVPGTDLEYALNVEFWQSITGTQAKLSINRQELCETCHGQGSGSGAAACPQCNGSGQVSQTAGAMRFNVTCPRCSGRGRMVNQCPRCFGDGRITKPEVVEIRIPPGTGNGSRLRVAGKGNAGSKGAATGDLYITIRVEPHPFFKREGDNIEIKIPVTVWEAALGAKIEVPTIDGRAILKVPHGTHHGQRFRMAEKGVFNARKQTRGHQIVEVEVVAPDPADERVRKLLRELSELPHEDPRKDVWSKI